MIKNRSSRGLLYLRLPWLSIAYFRVLSIGHQAGSGYAFGKREVTLLVKMCIRDSALTRYAGVSQPAVSKHLTVLKRAKLVRHRRQGRETHYRARPDALAPMVDWLNLYGAFWRDRFDRLESLLERMDP